MHMVSYIHAVIHVLAAAVHCNNNNSVNVIYITQICENGLLSFENNFCSADTEWRSNTPPIIAVLGGDIDKECHVSYGEITESTSNFIGLKLHVKRLLQKGFNDTILNFDPTHIFVATWFRVNDTQDNDSIVSWSLYTSDSVDSLCVRMTCIYSMYNGYCMCSIHFKPLQFSIAN